MHMIRSNPHYIYIIQGVFPTPSVVRKIDNVTRIYWCVAYLPSEASIIEH
jgi:hypothetical protein